MTIGSILVEAESKKAEDQKILKNYLFLTTRVPYNCWFTRAEREQRTGLILELQDLAKVDATHRLEDALLKQLDRALWRLGFNQLRDLKTAAKVRVLRNILAYDRPRRGRPKGGAHE